MRWTLVVIAVVNFVYGMVYARPVIGALCLMITVSCATIVILLNRHRPPKEVKSDKVEPPPTSGGAV